MHRIVDNRADHSPDVNIPLPPTGPLLDFIYQPVAVECIERHSGAVQPGPDFRRDSNVPGKLDSSAVPRRVE